MPLRAPPEAPTPFGGSASHRETRGSAPRYQAGAGESEPRRNLARIDLYPRVSCSKLAAEREGIGAVRKPP